MLAGDAGSATVLAAAAVGVLVLVLGLGLQLGAATLARHRAEAAADLGALAAAREVVMGVEAACRRGGEVVAAHGASLVACEVSGWTVGVVATVPCACLPTVSGPATGRARAGPVTLAVPSDGGGDVTAGDRFAPGPR